MADETVAKETLPETVHLFREGSWITVCCHRHGIDERLKLGTYEPTAVTCPDYRETQREASDEASGEDGGDRG